MELIERMNAMETPNINLEFGLASDLFWDPLSEREIRTIAGHGFSFLEIWSHLPWFDIYSPSMASELKAMAEANGVRIRSFHAPCEAHWDISSENEHVRESSVNDVILTLERCREVNGELVVVHPGRALASEGENARTEHDIRLSKSIQSLEVIQRAARDNGVKIAIENQWANEVGGTQEHFLRLLETVDPNVAGICFDSSHANITPGTYEMFRHVRHPFINTHLSDNNGRYDEHKPPFTAGIDWRMVLEFLLGKGYRGPWLLEVTNGGHDPLDVIDTMQVSIEKMRDVIIGVLKGSD